MSLRFASIASFALLAACSGSPPAPTSPPVPAAPSGTGTGTGTGTGAGSAAPAVSAAPVVARAASPFHVVARVEVKDDRFAFYLIAPEHGLFVSSGAAVMAIRDGAIVRDDAAWHGMDLGFMQPLSSIEGRWPDAAYAVQINTNGRVGWNVVYHWENAAWKPVTQLAQAWMFTGISTWDKGRLVGFATKTLPTSGARDGYEFRVLDGPHGGPMPRLTPPSKADCRGEFDVRAEIWPKAFLALPSGHVFVAGQDCDGNMAAEWFAPGATKGTIVQLAPKCWGEVTLAGSKPDGVFASFSCTRGGHALGSDPILQRFDGKAFSAIPYPGKLVEGLYPGPGGSLYVTDEAALRRWTADGSWSEIPLPPEATHLDSLHVAADDDLWATSGPLLLRTKPPTGEVQRVEWPAYGVQMARGSFARPRAATKDCESIYALLFSFTRVTPDDYDFPLTRKALAGHKELAGVRLVVTRDNGKKYFGAFAPSYDVGKKLVEVIQKGVPDSTPQLLCVKPEVVREMEIDLATGDVKKKP